MTISGYFEKIFSSDCRLSDPKIIERRLVICIRGIGVIEGHPLFEKLGHGAIRYFRTGHFIFDDVQSSIRKLTDFIGDPADRKFSNPYILNDGPFPKSSMTTQVFRFEGMPEPPHAWVDWTVIAASFTLEILDARRPIWDPSIPPRR